MEFKLSRFICTNELKHLKRATRITKFNNLGNTQICSDSWLQPIIKTFIALTDRNHYFIYIMKNEKAQECRQFI